MSYITATERLALRKLTLDDTTFIIRLLNTPGWLQFIGDRDVRDLQQAKRYLENGPLKSYATHGYGLWLVEKKNDKTPIGICGLLNRDDLEFPDIGFAFLPEYCGQGFALEIARATLVLGHNTFNLPRIAAITVPQNSRSIRLLEKIGLRFNKRFRFPGSEEELLLYCTQARSA